MTLKWGRVFAVFLLLTLCAQQCFFVRKLVYCFHRQCHFYICAPGLATWDFT